MPIIFVPGIKGSELVDTYPIDFPVRWSLWNLTIGNIFEEEEDFLLRDGLYDKDYHLFREGKLIRYAYGKLVGTLRQLDPHCYMFPYDWRRELEDSGKRLVALAEHISGKHPKSTIDFVTHSMGGLVLRSALGLVSKARGKSALKVDRIGRIVCIAPPFRGAADIPKVLIAGEKNGWFSDEKSYRKLARSFPAIYQLVPSYEGALVNSVPGTTAPLDPFNINCWQKNVTQPGKGFRQKFLVNAEAFVRGKNSKFTGSSRAPMLGERAFVKRYGDNTLILLATGHETTWQIPVDVANNHNPNWFDFENATSDELGDGRVHMKSAAIEGITLAALDVETGHGTICRDEHVRKAAKMWLKTGRVLKMKDRRSLNSVSRPGKKYFLKWNGKESSFGSHRVKP